MKRRAWSLVRPEPRIRAEAFRAGLAEAGCEVMKAWPDRPGAGDVLVIWNRYGENHELACRFERAGGVVLVAENGYIGRGGSVPKFDLDAGFRPEHYLALARGAHNDDQAGWPCGGPERWQHLGVELKWWRAGGDHVLVCPNRSFGTPGRIMPPGWCRDVSTALARLTRRRVVVRDHPGTHAPWRPLEADLENCWAVVVWHSSAGVHALARGVPVICLGPRWILKKIAGSSLEQVTNPPWVERSFAFWRLAWAQWTIAEIATGVPIRLLMEEGTG